MVGRPIGRGVLRDIEAILGERRYKVKARMNLFRLPIGVVMAPSAYVGMIVMSQWREEAEGRQRVWLLKVSIYHGVRQMEHILRKYGMTLDVGEKSRVLRAMGLARQLNLAVVSAKRGANVDELRDRVHDAIVEAAQTLGNVRVVSKTEALRQFAEIGSGSDRRGRANPSVMLARSLAAHRYLSDRLEDEIMAIDPRIQAWQKALLNMMLLAELRLFLVNHFLEALLRRDGLVPLFDAERRDAIVTHLRFCAQDLDTVDFRPYRDACRETSEDLRAVALAVSESPMRPAQLVKVRKTLVRCRSALAIKSRQVELERIIYRMTIMQYRHDGDAPKTSVERQIISVRNGLGAIDETGFRRPVCEAASAKLGEALLKLISSSPAAFTDARDLLKAASASL